MGMPQNHMEKWLFHPVVHPYSQISQYPWWIKTLKFDSLAILELPKRMNSSYHENGAHKNSEWQILGSGIFRKYLKIRDGYGWNLTTWLEGCFYVLKVWLCSKSMNGTILDLGAYTIQKIKKKKKTDW